MRGAALDDAALAGLRTLPDWRGKVGVALALKRLRERHGPIDGGCDLRLVDGSVVRLPRGSQMTWSVAATGHWDRHVVEFVTRHIDRETIAIDIGASLGLWSLPLGQVARAKGGRLWCFEPNPDNLPWLAANIDRNGLNAVVEIHPTALGSRPGSARLGLRERGGGNAALLVGERNDAVEVPIAPIDDFSFPMRVSFIKMDVEGFELEVLRGAGGLLERDRPVIFGEFNATWLRERGEDLPSELVRLNALGYDVFTLEQTRSRRWRPKDVVIPRRLEPPFAVTDQELLLIPA